MLKLVPVLLASALLSAPFAAKGAAKDETSFPNGMEGMQGMQAAMMSEAEKVRQHKTSAAEKKTKKKAGLAPKGAEEKAGK